MSVVGGFPFTFLGGDFPGIMGVEPFGRGGAVGSSISRQLFG